MEEYFLSPYLLYCGVDVTLLLNITFSVSEDCCLLLKSGSKLKLIRKYFDSLQENVFSPQMIIMECSMTSQEMQKKCETRKQMHFVSA